MTRQHATHGERDVVMTNLSVCLSVPLWCFIETNARKIKLFTPPGKGTAMVFFSTTAVTKFRRELPQRGR